MCWGCNSAHVLFGRLSAALSSALLPWDYHREEVGLHCGFTREFIEDQCQRDARSAS